MDSYEIIQQVRHDLGETDEAHWTDLALLRKLNIEQQRVWRELGMTAGEWLTANSSVLVSSGVMSLPTNCAKPLYVETASGYEVPIMGFRESRAYASNIRTTYEAPYYIAYVQGNSIRFNDTTLNGYMTLWYLEKVKDVLYGVAGANCAASSLHLDSTKQPYLTDDYYSGMTVNTYDATTGARKLNSTVSDYVGSTLIATITGTPAEGDLYGSELGAPEEAEPVILSRMLVNCLAKPSSALDPKYFEYHLSVMRAEERNWRNWIETRVPGNRSVRICEVLP